jgi:hypothetical protein
MTLFHYCSRHSYELEMAAAFLFLAAIVAAPLWL